jgi:hypothetical protein
MVVGGFNDGIGVEGFRPASVRVTVWDGNKTPAASTERSPNN